MPDNPYLGEYEAYSAQAKTAYQRAMAQIAQKRSGYLQGYGLDAQGNAVADAPHGAYQQMMGGLAEDAEAVEAAERARGFSGGLSRQAIAAAERMSQGVTHEFGQQFQQGLGGFAEAEGAAGVDYNEGLFQKMLEITERARQDRAFSTPDFSGIEYPGYGNPNAPNPGSPGLPATWQPPVRRRRRRRRR